MWTVDSLRALELTLALEARSSAVKSRRLEQRLAAALLWTRWRCESGRSFIRSVSRVIPSRYGIDWDFITLEPRLVVFGFLRRRSHAYVLF